ncbi:MAG TPA: hypothetical protein PLB89_05605 [Flavobacteriales bacterium]|nr:hypothetical protein [Flavobacteriales bacterium]
MGFKRFRTLRNWHNTLLMVWAVPFMLFPGLIIGAISGRFELLQIGAALCLVGLAVGIRRDGKKECYYTLEGDGFGLVRGKEKRVVSVEDVIDASLIDRGSARAYIAGWSAARGSDKRTAAREAEQFTHYCTMDIGLSSYTLGLGRSLIDRLPGAKRDLVLVRLKGDEGLLLSPAHAQDLVDSLSLRKLRA